MGAMADLRSVRACLDPESLQLLDDCAKALRKAGLFDVLLEQLPALAEGLQPIGATKDLDITYRFGPISELLLREYLAIASYDAMTPDEQRITMLRHAKMAGFV
jgi:hypothetical protein